MMTRTILLLGLALLVPVAYGQDKIDTPVWNIGDKWTFSDGSTVKVVNGDESSYTIKLSTSGGREIVYIYDKSSLNRLYAIQAGKRLEYTGNLKKLLNFPLSVGKSWKHRFVMKAQMGKGASPEHTFLEAIAVLGWDEIAVIAGKFTAIKLEFRQERTGEGRGEGKAWYWFSPDVKYLIKCQHEKDPYWIGSSDWELTSFEVKK